MVLKAIRTLTNTTRGTSSPSLGQRLADVGALICLRAVVQHIADLRSLRSGRCRGTNTAGELGDGCERAKQEHAQGNAEKGMLHG